MDHIELFLGLLKVINRVKQVDYVTIIDRHCEVNWRQLDHTLPVNTNNVTLCQVIIDH